jgi:putative thiamine transport system substrate-binding protein
MAKLPDSERAAFESLDLGVATLSPADLGPALDEPHPTWMTRVEEEWKKRYGVGN